MLQIFAPAILSLLVAGVLHVVPSAAGTTARHRSAELLRLKPDNVTLKAQLLDLSAKNDPDGIHAVVNLRVRFTLRNDGEQILYVIPEARKVVGIRFARTSEEASSGPYLMDRLGLPSFKQLDLLRITDHRAAEVKAVLPGCDWQWEDDMPLILSLDDRRSFYPPEVGVESLRKLDAFWCQFELRFWPHNMEEEGEQLETAWKDYGLLLQARLLTVPIRLNLKK